MSDRAIVRFLAEKVMGWAYWDTSTGEDAPETSEIVFAIWEEGEPAFSLYEDPESGDVTRYWSPMESLEDAFEVQAAIEQISPMEFARCLLAELDPDGTALRNQVAWRCANATARQRSLAAYRAMGGEA